MKSRLSKSSVFLTVRLSLSLPLLPLVDLPFAWPKNAGKGITLLQPEDLAAFAPNFPAH